MGLIQELADIIKKLDFHAVVYEYEQGLYFRNGQVVEKRLKRLKPEEEARIKAEEGKVAKEIGYGAFLPFRKPKLPKGYRRSWWTGLPLHKERFSRVLQPGFYLHLPVIDDIVKDSQQERVLNLGNITVPTTDEGESKAMLVSCNLRYELKNFYLAYTAVHDYEASLKDHTLSILARCSRGKKYEEWKDPSNIISLEEKVLEELRKIVTEKWGLKIHQVYITDNVPCFIQRLVSDGQSLSTPTGAVVNLPTGGI